MVAYQVAVVVAYHHRTVAVAVAYQIVVAAVVAYLVVVATIHVPWPSVAHTIHPIAVAAVVAGWDLHQQAVGTEVVVVAVVAADTAWVAVAAWEAAVA